jgi:short-subunit dehydrogenase
MRKTAFITGASSGIGASLAIVGAKLGYNLVLMARNADGLEHTANQCKALGAEVLLVQGDVSIEADCKRAVDMAISQFHGIDVLINNAGISMRAVFADTEPEVLKRLMDVNFWGTVYCTKYALPALLQSKGTVAGVSSIAGFKGLPGRTGYSASKFAMHGFLESLRCENLKTGLHVLIACPGYTKSDIRNTALDNTGASQSETPLNEDKLMHPDEVAERLWNAIHKKRLYMVLTLVGKLTVFINKWFPKLADTLAYNYIRKEPNSPFK